MQLQPAKIFNEYRNAINYKTSLGNKGLYEQNRINERFYIGDQWHGAKCGNDRPLVRHNVIKRIGEYKMSQISNSPLSVGFSADGVATIANEGNNDTQTKGAITQNEINKVTQTF